MSLQVEYAQVLRQFLARQGEVDLMRAYELGKEFQNQRMSPDELIGLHLETLEKLPAEMPEGDRLREVMHSFSVLIETMIAYGVAYADANRLLALSAREAEEAKFELERTIVDLDLANDQLRELDKIKTRFFANMSHELRTPLNSIIGFAEDAIDGMAGPLNPMQTRYVNNILGAGRHLLGVINDILDLAKLEAGKVRLELDAVHLEEVCHEVEELLAPGLKRKQQVLSCSVPKDFPLVRADRGKVFQILLNLLSNAHKYTSDGGTLEVLARLEQGMAVIDVRDNGTGIPADELPRLFEEFRQVRGRAGQQGTGLGLTITRGLVELHGGKITAASKVGVGSIFTFTLPLEPPAT
ncbi:MAG: hypothetical protein JWM80_5688 [Cyanobacteria bacterium RYN_339]|nr:hypothetical protein [Cyanobacteria bacterium RYN_339]